MQQVEAGLNLTVVLTSDGQCFQMGETGSSGRVKWEGCKEPELVRLRLCACCLCCTPTEAVSCFVAGDVALNAYS